MTECSVIIVKDMCHEIFTSGYKIQCSKEAGGYKIQCNLEAGGYKIQCSPEAGG